MNTFSKEILRKSITLILDRFHADYPFIDTKFDIVSGRSFDENDEPFRRKDCIYSWIQGRGLESLAKHALWFRKQGDSVTADRLTDMCRIVAENMERLRAVNHGRLPFAMHPDGSSFFPQEPSEANFSDLFYSKGLFSAARLLKNPKMEAEAHALFLQVIQSIRNQKFHTDQQSFDPKNKVAFVEGKFPQGPRMISLGGLADFAEACPEESVWTETAEEFIRFIFEYHVNLGKYPDLQKFDFMESVDSKGNVWRDGNQIFCDPGHALEFVGLAGKCLLVLKKQGKAAGLLAELESILPELFCHVFDYGFNRKAGGICKGYDLVSRKAINTDSPWWSLPETVRAGRELIQLFPGRKTAEIAERTGSAFQAFCQGFLQPSGFGCQTRSAEGQIIPVIPAVSDADPGYHTNLSLMDAIILP